MAHEDKFAVARLAMVEQQLRRRGIRREDILEAFAEVPRELFLPPDRRHEAYLDSPVPIGHGQTISQPYVVALMVEHLDPLPEHRVLDIGLGSGYQAAVLSRLVKHVYAVERIEALTEKAMESLQAANIDNFTACTADGSLGWPEEAPFDRIICGAAAPDVPSPWVDQLAEGGRIVLPVGGETVQTVIVVERDGQKVRKRSVTDVRFVKLIGKAGWRTV